MKIIKKNGRLQRLWADEYRIDPYVDGHCGALRIVGERVLVRRGLRTRIRSACRWVRDKYPALLFAVIRAGLGATIANIIKKALGF